jgi:Ser-tRNA(Ala) deacylase AlaX
MIPLYRTDPYLAETQTVVDRVIPAQTGQVIFCREALFMEGGGQPMDYGYLVLDDRSYPLMQIIKEKGNTGYVISCDASVEKGMQVQCVLDFHRRFQVMRLHTAQHALAGALRIIRSDLLTGGMTIASDADSCTVLYPAAVALTDSELTDALGMVHQYIREGRSVLSDTVSSEAQAHERYQELYRPTIASGSLKGSIRLVVIEGLDANACGGTHVRNLQEVCCIEIVQVKSVPEGRQVIFKLIEES